jgi:tRNA (guanine-N7-)-methyltransferase
MQGGWNHFFKNEHPLILELACGKGEYTVEMAQMFPSKNFIGVDIKGNRIWRGAKTCLEKDITNAAFLRTQIDKISRYFSKDEVDEIWITFPDPHLRMSKARKRLTHPKFLKMYRQFLKPNGLIHLKTDSPDLYHFTKKVIEFYNLNIISDIDDLYKNKNIKDELKIRTYYESLDIAKSNKIFYVCFKLPAEMSNSDEILNAWLQNEKLKDEAGIN